MNVNGLFVCLFFLGGGTGWTLTPESVLHRTNTIMSRAKLGKKFGGKQL